MVSMLEKSKKSSVTGNIAMFTELLSEGKNLAPALTDTRENLLRVELQET